MVAFRQGIVKECIVMSGQGIVKSCSVKVE
jgi:hypothetical protein